MNLKNTRGYSTVAVMITTSFLLIISTTVLSLIVRQYGILGSISLESRTYIASEGALEYSLLKLNNHREGFQDKIEDSDLNSKIFSDSGIDMFYEIDSSGVNSSSDIISGDFSVIPLFSDNGKLIGTNEKDFEYDENDLSKISFINFNSTSKLSWNLVGSEYSIAGVLDSGNALNTSLTGISKQYDLATKKFTISDITVGQFLNDNERPFLIIFNLDSSDGTYTLNTDTPHSLPETKIIASAIKGDYRQNLSFEIDNSDNLSYLALSFINS